MLNDPVFWQGLGLALLFVWLAGCFYNWAHDPQSFWDEEDE